MTTAGYHPAFVLLGTQFANAPTQQRWPRTPAAAGLRRDVGVAYRASASQNPSTEQLVNTMHSYAKGDTIDFDDEEGAEARLLWAKAAWHAAPGSRCAVRRTTRSR